MVDEKVYVMEDGTEYILGERLELNGKRFLLLYQKTVDNAYIAYEENGRLVFIDENFPSYFDIFGLLLEKLKNNS